MSAVRMNVSLPKETFDELNKAVQPRKRSRFISKAIRDALKEQRAERLAREYAEAAEDSRRVNQELEGVIADGLDQKR